MKTLFDAVAECQVQPIVEALIKDIEQGLQAQKVSPLKSIQAQLKEFNQHKQELSQELTRALSGQEERQLISQGIVLIFNDEDKFAGGKMCVQELKEAGEELLRPSKEGEKTISCFNTAQEQYKLSESCLHSIYGYALVLLQDLHRLDDALSLFTLLTHLNPYVFEYWLARGICWLEKQRYFEAVYAFSMASLLDFDKPLPHFYSSQCYLSLNQEELAKKTFTLAISKVSGKDGAVYEKLIASLKNQLKMR